MIIINSKTLLSFIKPYLPKNPIILEAGAFNGKDTQRLSSFWPEGIIHAFEPVPEIFTQLCAATASYSNIYRYPIALSNTTGNKTFYSACNPKKPTTICQAGSLLKPKDRLIHSPIIYPKTLQVPTITLDDWAKEQAITHIDFMWLDIQGHELAVLQASPHLLSTIKILSLEVNFIQAYEQQPQEDEINSWLISQGFEPIAQDFTDSTHWFFGNRVYRSKQPKGVALQ